jgi:hypothetical protein
MKNFIIGYGETPTHKVEVKKGSSDKKHPYTLDEAKRNFISDLSETLESIGHKPSIQCANDQIVIKFIQHPSYLAKTYYPRKLFEMFGMKDVGTRSVKIKPKKWAVKKHPEEGLASCVYASGTVDQFQEMLTTIESKYISKKIESLILSIEKIDNFSADEKIKFIESGLDTLKLEVVLHANSTDTEIKTAFEKYLHSLNGESNWEKSKVVGGLTFLPVEIEKGKELGLAEFSQLRALRSIPKLRFNKPNTIRESIKTKFSLPTYTPLENDFKVCIFDGGIGENHLLGSWVKEEIPDDITTGHPDYLSHGSEVCATYLFGPFNTKTNTFGTPYTNVDIVRVLSHDDENDPDLFDVLTRIQNVLNRNDYKYVNLSLGPHLPIDDDDVHVWTSVLDEILQKGDTLVTVAIGNDGDLDGDNARIQPPSDMVNCFAIGASNSNEDNWERAPYSCIGPGRSPGLIKPDGVIFGGSEENLFNLYSPLSNSITGTMGTSFAAPFALRIAAGIDAITSFDLRPTTIKALMLHHAERDKHKKMEEVGWGRLPNTPEDVIECLSDEAIIVYQGEIKKSEHLRIPIPIPDTVDCTWIHLKATFCITSMTDPEHPLHYTRGGLEVTFRANEDKRKEEDNKHADTKSFFSNSNLYKTEEELRSDAYKWETSISKSQRFKKTTLSNPIFDVSYQNRERGGESESYLTPLQYSLIVSIRAEGDVDLYNKVLQQNQTLQPVTVTNRIQI